MPTVTVTVTDASGNVSAPASASWTVQAQQPALVWGSNYGSGADTTYYQGRPEVTRIFLSGGQLTSSIAGNSKFTTPYNAGIRSFIISAKDYNPTTWGQCINSFPDDCTVYACWYHEPEDNFTTSAQIQTWKTQTAAMANAARANGGVPCVILMQWTLNPNSGRNIADWVPPAGAIDVLGFDYYPSNGTTNVSVATQTQQVQQMLDARAQFGVTRMLLGEYGVPFNNPTVGVPLINAFKQQITDTAFEVACYFSAVGTFDARFSQQTADAWFA